MKHLTSLAALGALALLAACNTPDTVHPQYPGEPVAHTPVPAPMTIYPAGSAIVVPAQPAIIAPAQPVVVVPR